MNSTKPNKKNPKTEEINYYDISQRSLSKQFRIYVLPIFSVVIFLLLVVFVTVPSINKYSDLSDKLAHNSQVLQDKRAEIAELENLVKSQQLNNQLLDQLDRIIPTAKTEVVEFQGRVTQIARQNNIEVRDIITGERIFSDKPANPAQANQVSKNLKLIQIPTQFELVGKTENFQKMLSDIYNSDDFIVISEMKMQINDNNDATVEIVLSKYQYADFESAEQERQLYNAVSYKESPRQEVIDFIERKSDVQ